MKKALLGERGWIGVDLDGTLAYYDGWKGADHIGEPIRPMLERVKEWRRAGLDVRIFTARASKPEYVAIVRSWLSKHGLGDLPITNVKDFDMMQLWDDRAVQVITNTGKAVSLSGRLH